MTVTDIRYFGTSVQVKEKNYFRQIEKKEEKRMHYPQGHVILHFNFGTYAANAFNCGFASESSDRL